MAKIYHPFIHEDVPASAPHPDNTHYRVSFGIEYWGESPQEVAKVQMIYDGEISGRRSPSYPSGTKDLLHVMEAFHRLEEKAMHMPMSAERFRAFSPGSPAARLFRKNETDKAVDRIVSEYKKKTGQD